MMQQQAVLLQRLSWALLRSRSREWRGAAERWLQQGGVGPSNAGGGAPLRGLSSQAEPVQPLPSAPQQPASRPPPHEAAAVDAAVAAFASGQQRVVVRLPRAAGTAQIAAGVAAHAVTAANGQGSGGGSSVLLLADGAPRADELAARLRAALPPGAGVARVPGAPLQPSDAAVVVDLRYVAAAPRTAWQLLRKQHHERLRLAVLDEPLLVDVAGECGGGGWEAGWGAGDAGGPAAAAAGTGAGAVRGSRRSAGRTATPAALPAALAAAGEGAPPPDPLATAVQLLRETGFLEPSLNKRLLTVSGRFWEALAPGAAAAAGASSFAAAALQAVAYQMGPHQAAAAGVLAPLRTAAVQTDTPLDTALLPRAGAPSEGHLAPAPVTAEAGAGADGPGSAGAAAALDSALCSPARLGAVVDAYLRLCPAARAVVHAAGPAHARALAVALSLRGVPAVPLHGGQPPAERAAVLAAFASGSDRVLATALPAERLDLGPAPIEALLMAAPTANAAVYAARLAPALVVQRPGAASDRGQPLGCLVVDFVDDCRGDGGGSGGGAAARPLRCRDVLLAEEVADVREPGGAPDHRQPTGGGGGDAAAADVEPAGGVRRKGRLAARADSGPTTGQLEWVVLADGSWAMPLSRQRVSVGSAMTGVAASAAAAAGAALPAGAVGTLGTLPPRVRGATGSIAQAMRVVRLRRNANGLYKPELDTGAGADPQPLDAGRRKSMALQQARAFAEAWIHANDPSAFSMHELASEWKDRPASDAQLAFCLRHGIAHDAAWTKGQARRAIDRYIVQEMSVPPSQEQLFYLRHLAPLLPPLSRNARVFTHSRVAELTLRAALTGGARVAGAAPLPAREALLADCHRMWAAGLRPRYTWVGVNARGDMVLDLFTGCYVWLRRVGGGDSTDAGGGGQAGKAARRSTGGATAAVAGGGSGSPDGAPVGGCDAAGGAGTGAGPADPASWPPLDRDAPYLLSLELPDGAHVPLTGATLDRAAALFGPVGAIGLPTAATAAQQQEQQPEQQEQEQEQGQQQAAAGGPAEAPRPAMSLRFPASPLHRTLVRGEIAIGRLATAGLAVVHPRQVVRVVAAVGGWKIAGGGDSSPQQYVPPAGARQLEALRSAGLPANRRYTALDAHRELLRDAKARGLPEPPVTPAQLARIRELGLGLPGLDGGSGGGDGGGPPPLTYAQARGVMFKVVLAQEAEGQARRGADVRPKRHRKTITQMQKAARRFGLRLLA